MNKEDKARKFCTDVKDIANEASLPFFVVTDGASATSNNGCEAVRVARQNHIEWEKKNNIDPNHSWVESVDTIDAEYKLPLGIIRQACMKLDSFISDLAEVREDADVDKDVIEKFTQMMELAGAMQANLVNIVSQECGEEDFLNESIEMDSIPEWGDYSYMEEAEDEEIEDIPLD